jgi:hypothetical protein
MRVEVNPIDQRWLKAVAQADRDTSPDPIVAYLQLSGTQLGPGECWWLRQLLVRMQFKRKSRGNFVPLGQKSRKEILETCAAYVRDLMRTEKLPSEAATTRVMGMHSHWFKGDEDLSLHNFMKRGSIR